MRLSQVRLITGLCLLWLAGCAASPPRPSSAEYQVSGGLKGVGGGRLPAAQAQLFQLGESHIKPVASATTSAEGHFSLVAPGPGDYVLQLAAPGYPTQGVHLQVLPDERQVSLEAVLEPHAYLEKPTEPLVVGSWNERDFTRAEPMQAQPDGTWVLERAVPGDSVTYDFLGLLPDEYTSVCPEAAGYEVDEYGSYLCRVPVKEGRVRIVLDSRKLPRAASPTPLQVTFAPPYTFLNPLNALHSRARTQSALASRQESKTFDHGTLPDELLAFSRDSKQPLLSRQLAALDLLGLSGYSFASAYPGDKGEALARELLQLLPTDSPRWGTSFSSAASMETLASLMKPEEANQLVKDLARRNPEVVVQAYALYLQLEQAQAARDVERATAIVEQLQPLQSKHPFAGSVLGRYAMQSQGMKGKPVPAFSATLMDGKGEVSRESLMGRFYLIDFWATWCKGCVEDIPAQEAALEKFKGRGQFTVLSVSMDSDADKVRRFREGHQMPWLHVLNGANEETSMAKGFDVQILPTVVLVDAQGRVAAMGTSLRGERLEKTLDQLLPPTSPASAAGGARRTAD